MVANPVQPNKTQWPQSGPIQIYINTKRLHGFNVNQFLPILDKLIKSLPGWSETGYELRWANDLENLDVRLYNLKKLSKPPRCVAIIIDEENQEKESLPYLLENLHNLSHGFSAAIVNDAVNDDLYSYTEEDSSLYVATKSVNPNSKIYTNTHAIHALKIPRAKPNDNGFLVPNLHWPLIKSNTLETLLGNLANYFIVLGWDLGIIKPKQANNSDTKKVPKHTQAQNNELLELLKKQNAINMLKPYWNSILTDVKLFQVTDPEGNLCLAYNFAMDHSNFHQWTQLESINLTDFPDKQFLQELCGKNKITKVTDLQKVFEYLGFKTINLSGEELAKQLIEQVWDKLSAQYNLFKFPGYDGKEKVFYSYCKQIKPDRNSSDGIDLKYFPSSKLINSILNKAKVDSSTDLKKLWSSLGIKSATDDEENLLLPKLLIEKNWDQISKNTNIYKIKTDDGKEKYFFSFASGNLEKWGHVGQIGLLRFFFDKNLLQKILNKQTITSLDDLKKVFDYIGLSVATEQEEQKYLPKKIIETNWAEIYEKTGIIQFEDDNGKTKYSFNFARSPSLLKGHVPGAGTQVYSSFPSPDFTEKILENSKRTQETIDEMKKVWQAMGFDIASPADEKILFRKLIEDNWDAISKSTGIIRNPDEQGFQYDFSKIRSKKHWDKVGNHVKIASFPSIKFIRDVLGEDARAIRSKEDLKTVWSALGLKIIN